MELKEGLKILKEFCFGNLCQECQLAGGCKECIFTETFPECWDIDKVEKVVLAVAKEEQFANSDNEKVAGKQPCDMVNHPAHYTQGGIECIDAIKAAVTGLEGIEAVCTGNIIRYIWRWKFKNGLEDLKKCRWYIDKLIEEVEGAKE